MKKLILFILICTCSFQGISQDGSLDMSFGNQGMVEIDYGSEHVDVRTGPSQFSDGSYLVIARTLIPGNDFIMHKFLNDGTLDSSFGDNGVLSYDGIGHLRGYWTVEDDKTLLYFQKYVDNYYGFSKFLSNGMIDTSFGNNGELYLFPSIDTDGSAYVNSEEKIISSVKSGNNIVIKRYTANGNLDPSFGTGGEAIIAIQAGQFFYHDVKVTADDSIFITAELVTGGTSKYVAIKAKMDGTYDSSFGIGGVVEIPHIPNPSLTYQQNRLDFFENGDILINSVYVYGDVGGGRIYKITSEGTFISSFGNNGYVSITGDAVAEIKIQQNQRFLVLWRPIGISGNGGRIRMRRYYAGGDTDTSFSFDDKAYPEMYHTAYIIDDEGKILLSASKLVGRDLLVYRFSNNPLSTPSFQNTEFLVYPNPVKEIVFIDNLSATEITSMKLYDLLGREVMTFKGSYNQINVSPLSSGVFILKIETDNGVITKKIVKK